MKKSTMITGYASALMVLAGLIFKLQHWPGASVFIVFGCAAFSLGYGIQLFLEKRKVAEDSLAKFIAVWVLILMILLPVSLAFKMQHWPGASVVIHLAHLLLFVTIPILIIYAIRTKDVLKKLNFHNEAILVIFLFSFSIVVWHMRISKNVLNSFLPLNETVVKEMKYHESKSNELFSTLENAVNASNAGKNYLEKAKVVKNASDSMCIYILEIENMITKKTGQEKCNFDSLTVFAKDVVEAPSLVMIVENKGEELKQKLMLFKAIVDQNTNSRGKEIINVFFNTDDPKPTEGDQKQKSWATNKFQHLPLIAVLFELNQLRSNVRLLEAETMIYLQAMAAKSINNEAAHNEAKVDKKDKK